MYRLHSRQGASETWRGQSRERQTDRLPDRLTRATAGRLFVSTPIPPSKTIERGRTELKGR